MLNPYFVGIEIKYGDTSHLSWFFIYAESHDEAFELGFAWLRCSGYYEFPKTEEGLELCEVFDKDRYQVETDDYRLLSVSSVERAPVTLVRMCERHWQMPSDITKKARIAARYLRRFGDKIKAEA